VGHFSSALSVRNKVTFVNLYAQFHYGQSDRELNYSALKIGLQRLVNLLDKQKVYPKIGTYYMGCFHAGGNKVLVRRIFEEVFQNRPLYVYSQP